MARMALTSIVALVIAANATHAGEIRGRMFDLPERGGRQIGAGTIRLFFLEILDERNNVRQPLSNFTAIPGLGVKDGNTLRVSGGEFGIQFPAGSGRHFLRIDFERSDGVNAEVTQTLNLIVIDGTRNLVIDVAVPQPSMGVCANQFALDVGCHDVCCHGTYRRHRRCSRR